jgi:tetratricopeptide (TPR) repeat protein
MKNEKTPWQQALEHGKASEALRFYVDSAEDDLGVESSLENLVTMQRVLREKNPAKARQYLTSSDPLPQWTQRLFQELDFELQTLEQATKTLERHEPDQTLELLATITQPLLGAEVETLRGTALIYHNRTSDARQAFEKALELDPQHYRAMTNLGNLALESNNVDEAITRYEQALKLNENFANAYHNLAVAYRKKGMVSKSVSQLKKAQRVSQQKIREEARGILKNAQMAKYLRWFLFAAIALLLFWFLRQRGP